MTNSPILILGGTGKVGRRVTTTLRHLGLPVRAASRSSDHRFDFYDESTWEPVLTGVGAAYLVPPHEPGAASRVAAFARLAASHDVTGLVLQSGRGVGSPGRDAPVYQASLEIEDAVRGSGLPWTILRPAWFAQNFSEAFLLDGVLAGEVRAPTGDGAESFIDADDIAAVAVAALTRDGHAGQTYELSGPRALTFAQATAEIARASGRHVRFVSPTPQEYVAELARYGVPRDVADMFGDLFAVVRRGLSEHLSDGVQRVLGRAPRDFADWASTTAATGVWRQAGAA
ncbi:MAG: NAD(P)H-binding protein [Actinomycetota bacterium]|nr:NAD(P)H-binding protein [Actinomycetota bacterium]